MGFNPKSIAAMLENIVYFELRRRGYEVYIGKNETKEIDFVAVQRDERIYVQVCRRLPEESDREVANLLEIKDHYPKYVVTLDELAAGNINGVKIVHLADFLLSDTYRFKSVIQWRKKGGCDQTGRFSHLLRGDLQKCQALDWQAGGGTLYPLPCVGLCVFLL